MMCSNRTSSILSLEERNENEVLKHSMFDLIQSGQSILIVGAGCSAYLGYPTWPELLKKLEDKACQCGKGFKRNAKKRSEDPLGYVDDIQTHIISNQDDLKKYEAMLYDEFKPKKPDCHDLHETLVSLPYKGIITTNFDTVMEAALAKQGISDSSLHIDEDEGQRVSEFLLSLDYNDEYPKRVAHLHGIYTFPQSIILSQSEYNKAYNISLSNKNAADFGEESDAPLWSFHRKLLWAILATRRAIFIGFSMNDPYLNEMLNLVSDDFWRWGKPIHFAIMPLSKKPRLTKELKQRATELKDQYSVGVVFYENIDGKHKGLLDIIDEIAERCGLKKTLKIRGRKITEESPWSGGLSNRTADRIIKE